MRARAKLLQVPRMSQSNSHNSDGNFWCGRTSGAMMYNYYKLALGGSESDFIKNKYDGEPYNLVYPNGKFAAYTDENKVSQCAPIEPLSRLFGAKWDGDYKILYPYEKRAGGGIPTREQIEEYLAPLLDYLDENNPMLFASGLTYARGPYVSHFVVISGYSYDDNGDLWIQINDPATEHHLVEELLTKHWGVTAADLGKFLRIEHRGAWARVGDHATKPDGALYHVHASCFFRPNPFTADKEGWNGGKPPVPLLCDNAYHPGWGVVIAPKLQIPDNPHVITEFNVAWPINPRVSSMAQTDWRTWIESGAGFPIGSSLTWHGGVHILREQAADDRVFSIAPGRVVLARFPQEPAPEGAPPGPSAGFVLVKHEFDSAQRMVVKPALPPKDPPPEGAPPPPEYPKFYSLYMHLAPLSVLLDDEGYGKPETPRWLRELAPRRPPEARKWIRNNAQRVLVSWSDTRLTARAVLPMVNSEPVGAELAYTREGDVHKIEGEPTEAFALRSTTHLAIRDVARVQKQLGAFQKLAYTPTLSATTPLKYYNPLTGEAFAVPKASIQRGSSFRMRRNEVTGRYALDVVATQGAVSYVAIDAYAHPGVQYSELPKLHHLESNIVTFTDAGPVSLLVEHAGTDGTTRVQGASLTAGQHALRFGLGNTPVGGSLRPTELRPTLNACVALSDAEFRSITSGLARRPPTPAALPSPRALQFYNPLAEECIETSVMATTDVALALSTDRRALRTVFQSGTTRYVAVEGYAGVLDVEFLPQGQMVLASGEAGSRRGEVLFFENTVPSFKLYIDTQYGDDEARRAERRFDENLARTLENRNAVFAFRVRERASTGSSGHPRDRIWLDLVPVVEAPTAVVADMNARLDSDQQANYAAVRTRLERGLSCLYGVELNEAAGWEIRDGLIHPRAERIEGATPTEPPAEGATTPPEDGTIKPPRRLYLCQVEASDKGVLSLVHVKADTAEPRFEVSTAADFGMAPVHVFEDKTGVTGALVEVIFAVPESAIADNSEAIQKVNDDNRDRQQFVATLKEGGTQDLTDRGLLIGREPIGRMGAVRPQTPGASTEVSMPGFHFEVFSGANLIDANATGTDDQLTPVPNTTWFVMRDDDASDAYTAAFIERIHTSVLHREELRLNLADLPADALTTRVIAPSEWAAFSNTNAGALARIITAHHSLWRPEVKDLLTAPEARGGHLSDEARQALTSEIERLAWFADGVTLEGVDRGAPVFHYHPLRFVEWLITGFDLYFDHVKDPKAYVRVGNRPEVTLTRRPNLETPAFHFRTTVGEGTPSVNAGIRLEGVETSRATLPVVIKRGGLRRLQITQPRAEVTTSACDPTVLDLRIPVAPKLCFSQLFLLADNGVHLPRAGYSRATVQVDAHFNLSGPTRIVARLTNSAAFQISGVRVKGDGQFQPPDAASFPMSSATTNITPPQGATGYFERPGQVTLEVDVIARDQWDATTKVAFDVSGGDLVGTITKESGEIATRTLKVRPSKNAARASGEDLAKLQLYLSQIPAADGLPCYRNGPGTAEWGSGGVKAVNVSGTYTAALARALWRFCFHYSKDTRTAWRVSRVQFTADNGAPPPAPRGGTAPPDHVTVEQLRADDGSPARTGAKCADFPIVTRELLAEITARFSLPYVLPRVDFVVPNAALPAGATALPTAPAPAWNKADLGKTAILPLDHDRVSLTVRIPDLAVITGAGSTMQLKLTLPAAGAYRIDGSANGTEKVVTVSDQTPEVVVTLKPSGTVSDTAADNLLSVSTSDGATVLGTLQLAGSRDLQKAQERPGRDTGLLQHYLSQIRDTAALTTSVYKRTNKSGAIIDGKWDKASVAALALFKTQASARTPPANVATYPTLLAAVYDTFLHPPATPAPTPAPTSTAGSSTSTAPR